MLHHRTLQRSGMAVAVFALLLTGSENVSYGVGPLPSTPCPCAADGVCRPKRDSWGVYKTRWRAWPGEQVEQAPTTANGSGDTADEALRQYETPPPEQEDLRGPAKEKKAKKADEDTPIEVPAADELNQPVPVEEADEIDPFGQLNAPSSIPSMDDAPPALPASLQQAAAAMNGLPRLSSLRPRQLPRPSANNTQPVQQASWQQSNSIQLINPASAIIAEPAAEPLQQAIYYEASDMDE